MVFVVRPYDSARRTLLSRIQYTIKLGGQYFLPIECQLSRPHPYPRAFSISEAEGPGSSMA
ncbi:hypothetical protein CY34DRAFT_810972 [Suillus luteus UH-Slu-Lm8-n1]|uniref:Uncharacterized protein n=1 Tax=Suillus luteus UH-Slu-Lm8-n1 TaxID=930992 RepID=A0A0D0AF84_9AGAM|nr:hypothetical protein CY34DRAFT_810972 [Suillus luteus UH-Slu-Lm8-n1]